MDDTQNNKSLDVAATRKRRSSILKSQRPPRTPFSELEFNVATPTDTTKSRRVSFSRRNGVAEFVTNEAGTTTWKNFYEEHNKSLETSGNDGAPNAQRPLSIGQLGKRIFDQQFEEVEAVDFGGTIQPAQSLAHDFQNSLNNANFTQQLAALECTGEKLHLPQQNFELSELTDQRSKLFNDDLTVPTMPEMSNQMTVDFSLMQNKCDDLDEIQKDLNRVHQNVVGPAAFGGNVSEYIEVDLNMTHVGLQNDDMSITDTIHSPKVQEVSKSLSKKSIPDFDMVDKENIAVNPYAPICETDNFAVNEEDNKVLVFDGKKLTVQTEKKTKDMQNVRSVDAHQRRTIVLNTDDDLPNFITDPKPTNSKLTEAKETVIFNEESLSIDQGIDSNIVPISKAIVYEDGISKSSDKVIEEKRKTIVFDNGDISTTQAVPTNIIHMTNDQQKLVDVNGGRRQTIVYENDGDISLTQAVSNNVINAIHDRQSNIQVYEEKRKTIVYDSDSEISMTQAVPSNIIKTINDNKQSNINEERRRTIVYNNDGEISITQAVPSNIINKINDEERRRTIVYDNDGEISMTQAVPTNIINKYNDNRQNNVNGERRRTIVYDNDGEISMTQAVPSNIINKINDNKQDNEERRRTIVYNNDGEISMTQAVPSNIIKTINDNKQSTINEERRRTIVYDNDGEISMTQAVPSNIINTINDNRQNNENKERRRTIVYENDGDISMTQAVPTNIINTINDNRQNDVNDGRRKTIVFDDGGDISMTQAVPTDIIYKEVDNKQKTIVFDDSNISFTQAVPADFITNQNTVQNSKNMDDISFSEALPQNIQTKRITIYNDFDISMTQTIPSNIIDKGTVKAVSDENNMDVSITQTVPQNIIIPQHEKQKTVCFDNEENIECIPKQILPIIENALINECQANIENINSALGPLRSNEKISILVGDISSKTSQENTTNDKTSKILSDPNLVENMDISVNEVYSVSTDECLFKKVDNIKDEKSLCSQKYITEGSIIENDVKTEFGNLSLKNPIPNDMVNLQNCLDKSQSDNKSFKTENLCHESICENQLLVYQSTDLTKIKDTDQGDSDRRLIENHIENSPNASIEENNVIEMDVGTVPLEIKHSIHINIKKNYSEEKSKQIGVTGSILSQTSSKTKKSILNELLDMSTDSEECFDDKNVMIAIETPNVEEKIQSYTENKLSDVFIIRRDSCDKLEEKELDTDKVEVPKIENKILALEYEDEENHVDDLKNKLQNLNTSANNRHYEQVISSDIKESEFDKSDLKNMTDLKLRGSKSFKNADDTRELLQMLSEFTDRPSLPPTIDEEDDMSLKEEKLEETQTEPRRISFATNRRSIVLSKEDLLNNISMAQAALQQSRYIDETDVEEATEISNEIIELNKTERKSLRISSDVVKALQFDDSNDDVDVELSPLKKTAFGETTYMKETKEKSKVIPTYDVTDGIKELMNDLVKPMADMLPFEAGNLDKTTKKSPSMMSTQIQANLITSSQIDIDVELHSNPDSVFDIVKNTSLLNQIASLGGKALASVLTGADPNPSLDASIEEVKPAVERKSPRKRQSVPGQVLVFDQSNPLNNVLLAPRDYIHAHPYNPTKSSETLNSECERSVQFSATSSRENRLEVERVSTQYNVNVQCIASGDAGSEVKADSNVSIKSKPLSIDRSVEMKVNIKEIEINTEIAMKANSELLDANSSLTLVDDALARSTFDVDLDTRPQSEEMIRPKSPVRVIYKMDQNGVLSEKIESDITSNDGDYETIENKAKKRSLSPPHNDRHKSEITPKPQSKIQKISISPVDLEKRSPQKKLKRTKNSPKKSITVQQLMTEFNIKKSDQIAINEEVNHAIGAMSIDSDMKSVTSYASTKDSVGKSEVREFASDVSGVEWNEECMNESSSNLVEDCDSSANVVAKIDMLPFMGSRDCEWESSSGDVWSFLLFRSRLRVAVRLAHSYLNASRSRVRADTKLLSVAVDTVCKDEKDPLIAVCLRLATDAMRYECSRHCSRAGDVPSALQRCVSVCGTALQWLRAMRSAMMRLAFHLDHDGLLTLKVANIPLRSVWEISMKIELVVEDAQETAWPRAGAIDVTTIVADVEVPVEALRRVASSVPHDWGHVPKTIWKLFKYLKNKTRDDELYGIHFLSAVK